MRSAARRAAPANKGHCMKQTSHRTSAVAIVHRDRRSVRRGSGVFAGRAGRRYRVFRRLVVSQRGTGARRAIDSGRGQLEPAQRVLVRCHRRRRLEDDGWRDDLARHERSPFHELIGRLRLVCASRTPTSCTSAWARCSSAATSCRVMALQNDGWWSHVDAHWFAGESGDRPHARAPYELRHRLCRGPGSLVRAEPGAWRLQDHGWRQDLESHPVPRATTQAQSIW